MKEFNDYCRYQGVPLLSWKGPALAADLYGSPALRDCAILDFLVRRGDLSTIVGVLLFLGYAKHDLPATEATFTHTEQFGIAHCFIRRGDGIRLRLRTQLMPSHLSGWQDTKDYFQTVRWRPRVRLWAASMQPERLLVNLCGDVSRPS